MNTAFLGEKENLLLSYCRPSEANCSCLGYINVSLIKKYQKMGEIANCNGHGNVFDTFSSFSNCRASFVRVRCSEGVFFNKGIHY